MNEISGMGNIYKSTRNNGSQKTLCMAGEEVSQVDVRGGWEERVRVLCRRRYNEFFREVSPPAHSDVGWI